MKALTSLTIGGVNVAVSSPGTDQDGSSTLGSLQECQVPDGTIMHAELQIWAWITGTQKNDIQFNKLFRLNSYFTELKYIKQYLWRCSCLHWKAVLWHIYHLIQWQEVAHSGSRLHSRLSPCGACSSWSGRQAALLHQTHWVSQENTRETDSELCRRGSIQKQGNDWSK